MSMAFQIVPMGGCVPVLMLITLMLKKVNEDLSYKVRPLIRFIKAWKYYQNVPISSFYLELRIAKYVEGDSSITYSLDVKRIFSHLDSIDLRSMQDPMGVSGYINACTTDAKLEDAKSKLSTALNRAEKARDAEIGGDIKKAFESWDLLYNGNFPSYYY